MKFVKIDTEENFNTTDRYGIRGLPTLLLFKGGEQVDQIMGAQPRVKLRLSLEKVLA